MSSILPLTLEEAIVSKHGKRLIGPLSLVLETDGFTVVMGPNGAGKTTLLRLMHGLERPRQGSVRWNGTREAAQARQAFVFQTPILMRRTVVDNIAYPLIGRGTGRAAARAVARGWAEKVGIGDRCDFVANVLSGGERQKMAIARALIVEPEVLFLDEPTANLDGRSKREIEAVLKTAFYAGTRIVLATHDIGQARRLATDIVFIQRGTVGERTTAEYFFAEAETEAARAFLRGDIVE